MNDINSYDSVPYESNPYPVSSPSHLRTLGSLFGLDTPPLKNARVLELGCSSGGNILPFAYMYPDSKCIGIDLSKVQIEQGLALKEKAKIKNLELKCMSINDVDASMGKFDYIIVHGVFSWVPAAVQDKIFDIAQNNLSENGITYISYNTLPGWNMIKSIRDMMLYHTQNFADPSEKVSQARLLLQFLKDSNENNQSPYSTLLKNESDLLAQQPDYYLKHDHLEDDNHPFYFNEFMQKASRYNLQYLADAAIASMYLGNMTKTVADKLAEIKDIVRTEQYMDYITNRRFRSTLLCNKNAQLNRTLKQEDILKFYISLNASPEKPLASIDIENNLEQVEFYFSGKKEMKVSTTSKFMKAAFYTLCENNNVGMTIDEVATIAAKKLKYATKEDVMKDMLSYGMQLVLSGHISIAKDKPLYQTKIKDKPTVSNLSRTQVEYSNANWVTNLRHERVSISAIDKLIFKYFNGNSNIDTIKQKVLEDVKSGTLNISKHNQSLVNEAEIKKELDVFFEEYLPRLRDSALLI